jgi:hypothetical protein
LAVKNKRNRREKEVEPNTQSGIKKEGLKKERPSPIY